MKAMSGGGGGAPAKGGGGGKMCSYDSARQMALVSYDV